MSAANSRKNTENEGGSSIEVRLGSEEMYQKDN